MGSTRAKRVMELLAPASKLLGLVNTCLGQCLSLDFGDLKMYLCCLLSNGETACGYHFNNCY